LIEESFSQEAAMKKYLLLAIALIFVFYGTANADFYKWEDEDGTVHITDYPPPEKSSKNIKVHKDESGSSKAAPDEEQGEAVKDEQAKAKNEPDVVLYTKNSCVDCDKAREFLKSKNIKFTEYNIEDNKTAAKQRKEIDDSEDVPFAIINKNYVYGFSESAYNRVLKLKP
jgi:glutaredoxin